MKKISIMQKAARGQQSGCHPQMPFIATWAQGSDPHNKSFLPFGTDQIAPAASKR